MRANIRYRIFHFQFAVQKYKYKNIPNFYQQIGLKFEEETSEMLRLEHGSVWC